MRQNGHLMHSCAGSYAYRAAADDELFAMTNRQDLSDDQKRVMLISLPACATQTTCRMRPPGCCPVRAATCNSCLGRGTGPDGGDSQPPLSGSKLERMLTWCASQSLGWQGKETGHAVLTIRMGDLADQPIDVTPAADVIAAPGHARRVNTLEQAQHNMLSLYVQLQQLQAVEPTAAGKAALEALMSRCSVAHANLEQVAELSPMLEAMMFSIGNDALDTCSLLDNQGDTYDDPAAERALLGALQVTLECMDNVLEIA